MPEGINILTTQSSVNRAIPVLTITLLAGLSAYMLYPALFFDRSLVHGDNVHHAYSFLKFHHDVLHNGLSPLWTDLIYGGHALFAEGQAGLSNPINYLVVWLLSPEHANGLLHWLAMTAFGIGCYGLCRCMAISPASSMFASLAAGFSSLAIHSNTNLTAIQAMVWVPWTMWAFESWLREPCTRRAIVFGLATSMLVFSGYPHFLHGTVIYMLVSLWPLFRGAPLRETVARTLDTYWRTGLLAVAVCVAISCIQWLPLLELASLSHRQQGVDIAVHTTAEFLIKGLMYSIDNFARTDNAYFPNIGSLAVCVLASLTLLLPSSDRVKGHIVATLLLLSLGFGPLSPVYRFVTNYGIIPGIDSFRMMFPYFIMSIIGMAALAANTLDGLGRIKRQQLLTFSPAMVLRWTLMLMFWSAVIYHYHSGEAPITNYVITGLFVVALLALAAADKLHWYPLCAGALLAAEIILLKAAPFGAVETNLLTREPPSVKYIKAQEDGEYFKHFQLGISPLTFISPSSGKLRNATALELNHLVASTNLLWGIPSFSGALALKSYRKPITNDVVTREIEGNADDRAGSRVMDILSIKWVSDKRRGVTTSRHLVPVRDAKGKLIVWENPHARPMIQTYRQARFVADAEEALVALQENSQDNLYVEAEPGEFADLSVPAVNEKIILKTLKKSATQYRFVSNSKSGYWLFLADTWYPGWKATIDDRPVNVYTAQVLGKAVYVPPGEHGIKIYFRSDSFRLGALVFIVTLVCLLLYGVTHLVINGSQTRRR